MSKTKDLTLNQMRQALLDANINYAVATYCGGGDSGEVSEVEFYSADKEITDIDEDLKESLVSLTYVLIGHYARGFENNEGGEGSITYLPKEDKILARHSNFEEDSYEVYSEVTDADEICMDLHNLGITRVESSFESGYEESGHISCFKGADRNKKPLPEHVDEKVADFLKKAASKSLDNNEHLLDDSCYPLELTVIVSEQVLQISCSGYSTTSHDDEYHFSFSSINQMT